MSGVPAWAQDMQMHRGQTGVLDSSGWTHAKSTGGDFAIDMPCQFRDFTVIGPEKPPELNAFFLICDRADRVRFTAVRYSYPGLPRKAQQTFEKFAAGDYTPGGIGRKSTFRGYQTSDKTANTNGQCRWARMLLVGSDTFLMMIEPIFAPCSDLAPAADRFFSSVEVKSR